MLRRRSLVAMAAAVALAPRAWAQPAAAPAVPPEVAAVLPGATLQGSGRLRFVGLSVYDARLWRGPSPLGADWTNAPLALELVYQRSLVGRLIAER